MELRWILLCISIVIIALIAWHTSRSSFVSILSSVKNLFKRENQLDLFTDEPSHEDESTAELPGDIISLHIKAKSGESFGGEQLLIHLNHLGLRFGEMNIFHFNLDNTSQPIFSLASAYEPGTFDIDRMENFRTQGLSLFMQLDDQNNPGEALDAMLDVAEELCERLHGDLLDHQWRPLTDDQVDAYYSCLIT